MRLVENGGHATKKDALVSGSVECGSWCELVNRLFYL